MSTGLYIHIPYCKKKCAYCDFYSLPTIGGTVPEEYIRRVIRRIEGSSRLLPDTRFDTVYFGGGTPGLMTPRQAERILSRVPLAGDREITIEVNPESADCERLRGFRQAGINRLSVGVQTVCDRSLERLGRIHTARDSRRAFENARRAGFDNISGDMMLALGSYTSREMRRTADFLKSAGAAHISAYMLKIEKGTPYYKNPPRNLPGEDESADFYLEACRYLESLGYRQYEISNFAMEGRQSRHNNLYWLMEDYLGVGPSAHSCIGGRRFYYPGDVKAFTEGVSPVFSGVADGDEYIMLSLRLSSGLDFSLLKSRWGLFLPAGALGRLKAYRQAGYLYVDEKGVRLTPKGFLVENSIASYIMSRAERV